jgi:hypothetical protein
MPLTYDALVSKIPVAAYARNQDLMDEMPDVVSRAAAYVTDRLDHDAFHAAPQDVTIPTTGELALPAGTLEVRSLRVRFAGRGWTPLLPRHVETLTALFAARPVGRPQFYGRAAEDTVLVFPRPAQPVTAQLVVNLRPAALGPATQTNVLTERYEAVLRAAVLREAALFMADQGLLSTYASETDTLLTAVNAGLARQRRDETAQRPMETANVRGA